MVPLSLYHTAKNESSSSSCIAEAVALIMLDYENYGDLNDTSGWGQMHLVFLKIVDCWVKYTR